ncbi:TetR/AcrR family transcriptional regulator [Nocardia cyriacigeorgica]|uniref:TetR/AcrR family transcriptional regulator n=1 Tax=Nocardia cyriacigeorgica TaxID=135487 RepID=A0ABX0CQR4_9NOCA|nr:TetR/AcrR family transcriptional regulator [Nocardia cyriacigeorgica]NEW53684.1 TetR/AcrR family transcriptional regulator [Nocardia cyriacigeorgica]NEW58838.1 TetR/AcrR family transcriptional regulator [Nocardia cyriacigeorgica]
MARPKFTQQELLDGARDAVLEHGLDASLAQVCALIGAPTGSLYYRFASRDHLMASLWLRSIRRFHEGYLAAAATPDAREALRRCAVHIPRYCRDFPAEARAMMLYRHSELAVTAPKDLRAEVRAVNDEVWAALDDLAGRRYGTVHDPERAALVRMAVSQAPYGLVRPHVGGPVPQELDAIVVAAAEGILELGDFGSPQDPNPSAMDLRSLDVQARPAGH